MSQVATCTLQVTWANCAASEVHYFDAAQLEVADSPGTYSDGDYYDPLFVNYSDHQWAGGNTPKTGPSYFYRDFAAKFVRLDQVLAGTDPTGGTTQSWSNPNLTVPVAPNLAVPVVWNGQLRWTPQNDGAAPIIGYNVRAKGRVPGVKWPPTARRKAVGTFSVLARATRLSP